MKRIIFKTVSLLLSALLLTQNVFADDANIDGGGGELGEGTDSNIWIVSSINGGNIYDAEGLRVYLVNSSTGVPVSSSIDITNSSIAKTNIYNGQGKTKYEYKYINSALNITPTYNYTKVALLPISSRKLFRGMKAAATQG